MSPKQTPHKRNSYQYRNRQVIVPDQHLAVGVIVNVHGLGGEVKVELHTDFPERFIPGAVLYMGEELVPVTVVGARPHKGHMLLRLEGVTDRDTAESLRGNWLFVPESEAADLDEDTYWIHDLVGLTVKDEEGTVLGELQDVLVTGANDVYLVKPTPELGVRELLLPAVASVVLDVDIDNGVMTVSLPPGLIDD